MTRVAIIVVSHNSRGELATLLPSLTHPSPTVSHTIVVVDNDSTDDTPGYLRASWPAIHLIEAGTNRGFAAANNLGIRSTESEFVLLLNPDTILPPGAVDQLVTELDTHREVAAVGPRIVDGNGRAELSFGPMMSPWTELRQKLLVALHARRVPVVSPLVEGMTRRRQPVDWVSGACLLLRRTDLEAVGLLDERFFMYTEDVDLCASLRARGRLVLFAAAPQIVHLRGRSVASAPRQAAEGYRRSQVAFYQKHHPGWVALLRGYLKLRGQLPDTPKAGDRV